MYVPQESFFTPEASVFDVVAEGLGDLRDVLRRYHYVSQQLEHGENGSSHKELHDLQTELETQNGWQFDAAIKQTISELGLPENEIIANLSGGQKTCGIGTSMGTKTRYLLLDEPDQPFRH